MCHVSTSRSIGKQTGKRAEKSADGVMEVQSDGEPHLAGIELNLSVRHGSENVVERHSTWRKAPSHRSQRRGLLTTTSGHARPTGAEGGPPASGTVWQRHGCGVR